MMKHKLRWALVAYDALLYLFSCIFILIIYPSSLDNLNSGLVVTHIVIGFFCVFTALLLPIFRGSPPGDGGGIVKNR